jgi:hypothetical protein
LQLAATWPHTARSRKEELNRVLAALVPIAYIPSVLNNKTILDSPILLFLGAGASAPLGKPMMSQFVDKVSKLLRNDSQSRMMKHLREFRSDDLEEILGELDTLISLDYATTVNGQIQIAGGSTGFSLERGTAQNLRARIKREIIREYRNVSAEKTVEVYEPLFDVLFERLLPSQCLTIFTTNYDPAIEDFCQQKHEQYALCDGFEYDRASRQSYWSRSAFDNFQLEPNKKNIVLFKLHGSVDWVLVKANQKIRRGQAMYDQMDSDAYGNILIYPATNKIATEDPFYTGYEYFERCCERAKVCLAIGYSFRDYDALTRLRGAVSVNDRLHLLLVGPSAGKVLTSVRIPDERKIPLPFKFGEKPDELGPISECLTAILGAPKPS